MLMIAPLQQRHQERLNTCVRSARRLARLRGLGVQGIELGDAAGGGHQVQVVGPRVRGRRQHHGRARARIALCVGDGRE